MKKPVFFQAKIWHYTGPELKPYIGRPDAMTALALPSRTGDLLRYPDGRITNLADILIDENRSTK